MTVYKRSRLSAKNWAKVVLTAVFALSALIVVDRVVAQSPRRAGGSAQGNDNARGRGDNNSRDRRGSRAGGESNDRRGQGGAPEGRQRGGGPGGQQWDGPGGQQWGGPGGQQWGGPGGQQWGGPGGPGAPAEGENKEGEQGENAPRREAPVVDLETALKNTQNGSIPIALNQNSFRAADGVRLRGTYYKGRGDKETPVVVILPDLKRNRDDETIRSLALGLAEDGCAVLIPDLRGRGENAEQQRGGPNGGPGRNQAPGRQSNSVSERDVRAMINYDRELWFNFLIYAHNLGYCNVKKTIIVGAEFSAALASAWARNDWSTKGATGQNVVGLVLLSPDAIDPKEKDKKKKDEEETSNDDVKYDVLNSLESLRRTAKGKGTFGYLIVTGQLVEDKLESAKLIQRKIGGKADEELKPEEKLVPIVAIQTERQGGDLLEIESFAVSTTIRQFVKRRVNTTPPKRDKWQEIDLSKAR